MDRLSCDRMFAAVMETGSFTAAAGRRGVSSGQASKMVSRLEAELGVRLFNRTTRAVVATEAGRAYYDGLRGILDAFDELDSSVREAQQPTGQVRLSVPLSFGTSRLVPILTAFARAYPRIRLDVEFTDRIVRLVDEGFDAAVRVGHAPDSSLIARRLCEAELVVVAGRDYLADRGAPLRPAELSDHACILDSNFTDPGHWHFEGPQGSEDIAVQGRLMFSNADACLRAAEDGLGIAYMPDFVAADSLAAGRVVRLLRSYAAEPFAVHALYPPGRHLAAKVRVLVDFLADTLGESHVH